MGWITKIAQGIETAFTSVRPPLAAIPALLLLCEITSRPGLSAMALAAAIIRRLPEAGIETGVNRDGSPNKINQFVRIFSEEVVKEIKDNCIVDVALNPGSVVATGTGANAAGPVVVTTINNLPVSGRGIPR